MKLPGLALLLLCLLAAHSAAGRRLAGDKAAADADTTLPSSALAADNSSLSSNLEDAAGGVEMKIINGEDAAAGQFDFMVALFMNGRFFCGGVLLDNSTVLTAAHCVVDTQIVNNPSALTVWAMGNQYPVDRIFAHPGYSASKIPEDNADMTFDGALHDIAVIKLKNAVPSVTSTALLPAKDLQVADQEKLQVAGWGTTESGRPSNVLQFAIVEFLLPYRCPADYDDVLCGGGTGQNTCNGDSGGPLIARNAEGKAVVVGVTSHGPDCQSQPNNPNYAYGFYTDVRKYLDAIAAWRQGKEYQWSAPSPSPSGNGGNSSGGSSGGSAPSTPPAYEPSPIVWQPVPGWADQWGSGWGTGSSAGSASWSTLFCQVFGC